MRLQYFWWPAEGTSWSLYSGPCPVAGRQVNVGSGLTDSWPKESLGHRFGISPESPVVGAASSPVVLGNLLGNSGSHRQPSRAKSGHILE